jgi:ubiquinone biosynthesis monooxygenase Coq7
MIRNYSKIDQLLSTIDNGLKTLHQATQGTGRQNPADTSKQSNLTAKEAKQSAAYMRINHVGEVCAQALYQGQALFAQDDKLKATLYEAAREENDHLLWCEARLRALDSRTSYLNPLWYCGSFCIGALTSLCGDKISLGFLMETENQVTAHLENHLEHLPIADTQSRAVIMQMKWDEQQHATTAKEHGAIELAWPIKLSMRLASKVMTSITYYC